MAPGSNIILPGSTDSSGANIPSSNVNFVLDANELIKEFMRRKNIDPSNLQAFLTGLDSVRGSVRRTKTRLKKKPSNTGIQVDSAGLAESVAGLHEDDSDGPAFEVNEGPIDDINDIKTLLNTIQNSGGDTNFEVTEIQESQDGEITISWKASILLYLFSIPNYLLKQYLHFQVLVNKITEHKDSNYAVAIPKVVFVIAMCTFLIVGVMFMLYFMGTRL
jgi:hypothetical protein